jgi:hypothetical protein
MEAMPPGREIPLYDASAKPASWHERMRAGEFAVHRSSYPHGRPPFCTVFASMEEAVEYARHIVKETPTLRSRIYDHHGMVGAPLFEAAGAEFKGEADLGKFRRWGGGILFLGGAMLTAADWLADFRYGWPAMVGTRMLLPGLILLVTEGLVQIHQRRSAL